jgi:hypothetical protein
MHILSEFEWMVRDFSPVPPYQCSTGNAVSTEDALRDASVGTSERQTRLVFDPYSQVTQTICTSELLQASSGLSPAFALLRNRSSGF